MNMNDYTNQYLTHKSVNPDTAGKQKIYRRLKKAVSND